MKVSRAILVGIVASLAVCPLLAQSPILSGVEAPYPALQVAVHMAGGSYPAGTVAYGPARTPLVLSGSDFGSSGTVQFTPYTNGAAQTPVQATVTLWTPTLLFLTVPSGAGSGLVTVTTAGGTSNGLPFMVMAGTYSGSCPALPPNSQLQIVTSSLDDGMAGQAYSVTLSASGGTQAYTWSIASGSLPAGLSLNSSTGVISGTPTAAYGPAPLTVQVADSSSPQQTNSVVLSLTIDSTGSRAVIYSYCIASSPSASCTSPSGGYDPVGNVLSYTDSVTGTWSMVGGYDNLNRLTGAQATAGAAYDGLQVSWSYDSFGNRTGESFSGNDQGNEPVPASASAAYNNNNQVQSVGSGVVPTYDAAGNALTDTQNQQYLYDAEGRICAANGLGGMFGYLYNADGVRIAKGTITSWSCDTASNGFQPTASYILSPSNEQLTELNWAGGTPQWAHTNVWAAGELMATYGVDPDTSDNQPGILYFHLTDWLGTRRVLTDYAGNQEEVCHSLPYGDAEDCGTTHTEHLFTGKERDAETWNDYFGARYYASSMGRFLSPDWIDVQWGPVTVPGADFDNPQSFNLYGYVNNNPLTNTDPDGHSVNVCTNDANGNQQCTLMSNEQYQAAQQGNGGLNVPTLDQVGNNQSNGTFNATAITDANGNTVGTATYSPDNPGIDPFVGNNMAGYQTLGAANKAVTYAAVGTAVAFGGVAAAAAAPEVAAAVGRQGIKFSLEHGMRWEAGHTMVMATASEVKAAIGAAVASGLASGEIQQGVIKGQTMVNGMIISFTGFMNSAGQITISNVMGGFYNK